jgi:hypothetical protein
MRNPVRSGAAVEPARAAVAEYAAASRNNPQKVCEKNDAALKRKNPDEASNAAATGPHEVRTVHARGPSGATNAGLTAQFGTCRQAASASASGHPGGNVPYKRLSRRAM